MQKQPIKKYLVHGGDRQSGQICYGVDEEEALLSYIRMHSFRKGCTVEQAAEDEGMSVEEFRKAIHVEAY